MAITLMLSELVNSERLNLFATELTKEKQFI